MNLKPTVFLLAAFLTAACSNKQVYDGIKNNRLADCEKELYESARAECKRELNRSYDAYQNERRRLIEGENK